MTYVWREDTCRCHQRPMEHSGVKLPWLETLKGIAHQTNRVPTSFAKSLSNALTFGTIMIAREFYNLPSRNLTIIYNSNYTQICGFVWRGTWRLHSKMLFLYYEIPKKKLFSLHSNEYYKLSNKYINYKYSNIKYIFSHTFLI